MHTPIFCWGGGVWRGMYVADCMVLAGRLLLNSLTVVPIFALLHRYFRPVPQRSQCAWTPDTGL